MASQGWNGLRALVTGASSGIGTALAEQLAAAGASLVLTGRDGERLEAVARRCGRGGGVVEAVAGDLTDGSFVQRLASRAVERDGLDLVVHNAGVTMNARFEEVEEAVLRSIMEVDYFAPAVLTRRLLPALRARRGRIVAISSITGLVGPPSRSAYAAAKHALHGLLGSLRVELLGTGVSVTIVCPGYVDTPMRTRALLGDGTEQGRDQAEGRRMLGAGEVAAAALDAAWRRRREVLLGRETRLARVLSICCPGRLDRILAKATR